MDTIRGNLFPKDLPNLKWVEFPAEGFSIPVSGAIHSDTQPPTCGMPLGGIDTGCLDLEANGTFGFCTIFNSHVPRRGPLNIPFLGVSTGEKTWVLTTQTMKKASNVALREVLTADSIRYWGHYPVVDMEYETSAPIDIGLRAWTPFILGDIASSSIPGVVFEIHLRNTGNEPKEVAVAFSFPGPNESESGSFPLCRRLVSSEKFKGIEVSGKKSSYILGVLDETEVSFGGELGIDGSAWARISREIHPFIKSENRLPYAVGQPGASSVLDLDIAPGTNRIVRFILAWHSPKWQAWGTPDAGGNVFRHMYASRLGNVLEVAELLSREHKSLLQRVVAWQEVIYGEETLPVWLRDSLVNILHLITEDSMWAQSKPPIGEWCRPEDGLFGMNEDPHNCPQIECIPCSFLGNFPLVYFFPELALSTLRGYKAYQDDEGSAPWIFGGYTGGTGGCEMAIPTRGYQVILNGPCYVDMVDRYWMITEDDDFLREFYPSIKKNTLFTIGLNRSSDGIISMPDRKVSIYVDKEKEKETEWFEACDWAGMVTHVGGVKLASLRIVERMAEKMGDVEFAEQCRQWIKQGSNSLETKMWAGTHYLNYWMPETGNKCDLVMANQFDGEWMTFIHGLPRVFQPERLATGLETIKRTCVASAGYIVVNFTRPSGVPTTSGEGKPGWNWNPYAFLVPGALMLGMTYMYAGEKEFGIELCHRCWENLLTKGRSWDQANIMRGDTGEVIYGSDYYQNMMLWVLPAAMKGGNLSLPSKPGGLMGRVIQAGKKVQLERQR